MKQLKQLLLTRWSLKSLWALKFTSTWDVLLFHSVQASDRGKWSLVSSWHYSFFNWQEIRQIVNNNTWVKEVHSEKKWLMESQNLELIKILHHRPWVILGSPLTSHLWSCFEGLPLLHSYDRFLWMVCRSVSGWQALWNMLSLRIRVELRPKPGPVSNT